MCDAHRDLITRFYQAFQRLDAEAMIACYSDDIVFSDPVFGTLRGKDAGDMWRMLTENWVAENDIVAVAGDHCLGVQALEGLVEARNQIAVGVTHGGWAVVLGLGQGGTFALALTLIVLRSKDAHVAANLSSMAQGVGYTLASMGPFAVGLVHDLTGGWAAVGWIFAVLGVGAIVFGLGAGRALHVQVTSEKV